MKTNSDGLILVVEDNEDDVFFLKMAFEDAHIVNPVHVVSDGEAAIRYLAGEGEFGDRKKYPLPALMLLDLKLPRCPGLDLLRWVQERKVLGFPAIVFTSSSYAADIKAAYAAGVASFVVKPLTVEERRHFAGLIRDYWLGCNMVPPRL
ncbi:MAG TPA: response regulator [Verrucomicrobiae bacterium]|jgi:CheY-like chemotaxis protein